MIRKTLTTKLWLFFDVTILVLLPLIAACPAGCGQRLKTVRRDVEGNLCRGAEFIVLQLSQSGNEVAGTVSIANMNGPNGKCATVIDPPNQEHAMKIHNVQLQEKSLEFKGAGQTAFEMSVVGDNEAALKFLGTPVENHPWKLKRTP